jgi:hypothetical protein
LPGYRGQRRRVLNLVDVPPGISSSSRVRKQVPGAEWHCCNCVPMDTYKRYTRSFHLQQARRPLTARFARVHRAEPDAACVVVYLSSFLEVQPLVQVVASDDWCIDRYTPQLRTCETVSRCVAINSTQSTRERVRQSLRTGGRIGSFCHCEEERQSRSTPIPEPQPATIDYTLHLII